MQMAAFFIRPRNGGKAFELRIRHAVLGKPRYLTFDLRAEAERAAERALTALAAGTIRKKKGALSRVLDWVVNAHPLWLAMNPLHVLPHGYSGYDEYTRQVLAEQGHEIPGDIERNRRVDPDQERRIVELLERRIVLVASMEERAEAEGLSLMFQLAPQTAMRMREIYTLTMDQVQVESHKTIFLIKTKNGDSRQVPLTPEARALLSRPWPALEAVRQAGRLFPFWNGATDMTRSKRPRAPYRRCLLNCSNRLDPPPCISMTLGMRHFAVGFCGFLR
jgi:integrase